MSKQININSGISWASRGYNMYMGNILKCRTYLDLSNTVKSMMDWEGFKEGELDKLKKLALKVEQGIIRKSLSGQTEASHVKLANQIN